jgi:RHS repeat-associated protein
MDRPTGLTDQSNNTDVSSVTYNAANQLLGLNYLGIAETRQYNNLNQMTNLTAGSGINITYTFPAGANNGKISQQANSVSQETVTYQYDSLNRLFSASSTQSWGETYGYDGFGNLLSKTPTGGAPTLSQSVNTANNQIVGVTYDANGNQLSGGYGYDAENRMATATGIQYGYDSRNKRVWSGAASGSSVTQTVYFYGVGGQRLGIYSFVTPPSELGAPQLSDVPKSLAVYFGGKRVGTVTNGATGSFTQDRLGSNGSYYPYGEARGTVPQDDVGYATYTNDSATGLQYADQRYYASNFGRFMSPDPYRANNGSSGDPRDTKSWNRYAYVEGDPINFGDPQGLYILVPIFQGNIGGGGCGAIFDIAADPESESPGGTDCLFQNFPVPSFAASGGGQGGITPAEVAYLNKALNAALAALNSPDCQAVYNTSHTGTLTPRQVLQSMSYWGGLSGGTAPGFFVGDIQFGPQDGLYGTTTPGGYMGGSWTIGIITLNSNAADAGYFFSQNLLEDANTILHELGHVFANVAGLGGSLIVNDVDAATGAVIAGAEAANDRALQPCDNAALAALLSGVM